MRGIISFMFVLGTAILIHEIGHFISAGWFGILRHEFSIGMGPTLWKRRKGETLYSVRAIPIGGYVSMAAGVDEIVKPGQQVGIRLNAHGAVDRIYLNPVQTVGVTIGIIKEIDVYRNLTLTLESGRRYSVHQEAMYEDLKTKQTQQIAPFEKCLESKSKFARMVTLAAGALMNFLLAFVLVLTVGLVQGEPMPTNQLSVIEEGMPAQMAGLEAGDRIIEYNGYIVSNGEELIAAIRSTTEATSVTFIRDGETHQIVVTPNVVEGDGGVISQIGILTGADYHFSVGYAVRYAWSQFKSGFTLILSTVEMLFVTHEAGLRDLSGPVGVAVMASQVAAQGFLPLLVFASLINVNVGVLNLLPIPALDGGRIVFILIEGIIGRPINRKLERFLNTSTFILLMGVVVFVFFNDVYRIIR